MFKQARKVEKVRFRNVVLKPGEFNAPLISQLAKRLCVFFPLDREDHNYEAELLDGEMNFDDAKASGVDEWDEFVVFGKLFLAAFGPALMDVDRPNEKESTRFLWRIYRHLQACVQLGLLAEAQLKFFESDE